MLNGILWGIPYHSWPCPAHHFAYLFTLFRSIAMSGTMLACCFPFSIFAMIQTATSEVCQMLILLRHCVLMKMMTAIQLYHLSDCSFLSLNPAHSLNFYFSWSQTFDVSTVKPSAIGMNLPCSFKKSIRPCAYHMTSSPNPAIRLPASKAFCRSSSQCSSRH